MMRSTGGEDPTRRDNHKNTNWNDQQQQQQQQQLLSHVLDFTSPNNNKPEDSKGEQQQQQAAAVTFMVDHLLSRIQQQQHADEDTGDDEPIQMIRHVDVATLLLPWALSRVQRQQSPNNNSSYRNDEDEVRLVWKALSTSLFVLSSTTSKDSFVNNTSGGRTATLTTPCCSNILTQSVLFKLVPKVASLALTTTTTDFVDVESKNNNNKWEDPFTTYQLLLPLFHPTMEVACRRVWQPLVVATTTTTTTTTNHSSLRQQQQRRRVLQLRTTTLRWIRSIHDSRHGNPKTTFQLLADRSVFAAFARAYYAGYDSLGSSSSWERGTETAKTQPSISGADEDCDPRGGDADTGRVVEEGRQLVRAILYDGLFHPRHHVEGFYTLLLSSKKPGKAAVVTAAAKTQEVDNANDAANSPAVASASKPSFRSYHEELLAVVSDCLIIRQGVGNGERDSRIHVIHLLPCLLRGYFQQSRDWDRQERASSATKAVRAAATKRTRGSGDGLALVQFQLFQRWARPLLQLVAAASSSSDGISPSDDDDDDEQAANIRSTAAAALHSLRQMLELVLEFDAYTPSYSQQRDDGEERHQYPFLQSIAAQVLALQQPSEASSDQPARRAALIPDSIHCMRLLLRLNHMLLQDDIVRGMLLCLQSDDIGETSSMSLIIIDFFYAVVDTYRLLRQQSLIISSFLGVVQSLSDSKDIPNLTLLDSLLEKPALASAIGASMQSCPILEVKEVVGVMSKWIVQRCKADFENAAILGKSLDVALRLSAVTLRNIRVDRGTAADVAAYCKLLLREAVCTLAETGTSSHYASVRSDLLSASLTLCGLVLDLHTRCEFWLGRNEQLPIPSLIAGVIESVEKDVVSRKCPQGLVTAVTFLSCHRLRQLHSEIYDADRNAMENSSSGDASTELSNEATRLAFSISNLTGPSSGRHWIVVAQNFHSWVPYADTNHVDQFLQWVISSASISLEKQMHSDASLQSETIHEEEAEAAKFLLSDSSFFEHGQVADRIFAVGITVAADRISSALSSCTTVGKEGSGLHQLVLTPLKNSSWKRSKKSELLSLVKDYSKIGKSAGKETASILERALYPILLVNGMPSFFPSEDGALDFLDILFRLEHVCRSIGFADGGGDEILPAATSVVAALRKSASKLFTGAHADAALTFLCERAGLGEFVCGLMNSAIRLLAVHNGLDLDQSHDVLGTTGDLVERAGASSPLLTASTAQRLSTSLFNLKRTAKSAGETRALACLARRLLAGLDFTEWPSLYASFEAEGEELCGQLATVFTSVYELALEAIGPLLSSCNRKLIPDIDGDVWPEGFLLLGDLLRIKDASWLPDTSQARAEMQELCMGGLRALDGESVAKVNGDVLTYLVGCLIEFHPSTELTFCIVDALITETSHVEGSKLLDACLCHTIPSLEGDSLLAVLKKLTNRATQCSMSSIASRLRLFAFLLRYSEQEDQIEALSSFGWKIFLLALQPMHANTGANGWATHVVVAASLVEDLVKRRDVLTFRERDLALILSYISGTLGPGAEPETESCKDKSASRTDNDDEATSVVVFAAMTGLFSTMFQRYTKQLYACVPSAISVLHCFLRHVMYAPRGQSVQSVTERSQRFSRICELLVSHKDIYKKHVVGLVLEFVRGLGVQSMDLQVRDSLVPAVYCLLDCMSTYETQQLDAHMDTKAKTLFRSIHQGYQKIHTYKGQ